MAGVSLIFYSRYASLSIRCILADILEPFLLSKGKRIIERVIKRKGLSWWHSLIVFRLFSLSTALVL